MSRRLQILNFVGVLALAVLCVLQWRHDRQLNFEVNRLEKLRIDNEQKIKDQGEAMKGLTSDLTMFKEQFNQARTNYNEAHLKLRTAERENSQLTDMVQSLKESTTNWAKAVAERDDVIKEANGRIKELADKLNASIGKYNELATNYNTVVKDLNETRTGGGEKK